MTPLEPNRRATLLAVLALIIAGTLAYLNSFSAPMVFDDLPTIQKNAGVQFGDFLRPEIATTRPILYVTFTINYLLHQERVWGYHLVNLVLHLLNGIVIYFIACTLLRDRSYAFLAAAFFLLHPLQTESVTYISSRSETLSTLFYALGVLFFVKRRPEGIGFLWSLVILLPFLLGLGAKETVITLPAILLLIDFLFLSEGSPKPILKRWSFYATFVVGGIFAAYFLITRVLVGSIGPGLQGHLSRYEYFLTQIRVVVTYVRLIILPVDLNLDYDVVTRSTVFDPAVILSALFLAGLIALAWYLRRREPVIAFAIFGFLITLSPTSSVIPILDVMFEHRLYLPMIAVCLAFPAVISRLVKRTQVIPVCAAILLVLTIATVLRNQVWNSDLTLWADVIQKSPEKSRGYNSLALGYFKRGDYDKSLATLKQGYERVSGKMDRHGFVEAIGNMYMQTGRLDEAAKAFEETTRIDDPLAAALAYNNLGNAYWRIFRELERRRPQIGDAEFQRQASDMLHKAQVALVTSVQKNPNFFWPFDLYIDVVVASGQADPLAKQMTAALETKREPRALYALGKIAMLRGDYAAATPLFKEATERDPTQKVMFFNYGYVLERGGRLDEAAASYRQAIRLDPLFGDAHHNLGLIYSAQKKTTEALLEFEASLRLNPMRIQTHLEMARILIRTGDLQQARSHLIQVLNISPQDPDATQMMRTIGS